MKKTDNLRKILGLALTCSVLLAILPATTWVFAHEDEEIVYYTTFSTFDPNPMHGYDYGLYKRIFGALFAWDEDMNMIPWIAERAVRIMNDTWVVFLRDDVKFHDGVPLTSADVKFTFDLVLNYSGAMSRFVTGIIKEVQAPDPYTVVVKMTGPIFAKTWLTSVYILPKHDWEAKGYVGPQCLTATNIPFIGAGQWKYGRYVANEYLILEAYDDFFLGRPIIDKIYHTYMPEAEAIRAAFLAGEIESAGVPWSLVEEWEANPDLEIWKVPTNYYHTIYINVNPNTTQSKGHPALLDLNVRKAIAHCVNRTYLNEFVFYNAWIPAFSVIPPSFTQYYASEYEDLLPEFNTAKAAQILEDAGYVDRNGDGIREMSDGTPLSFRFEVANYHTDKMRALEIIRDWMAEAGMEAVISVQEGGSFWQRVAKTCDYDLAFWGWQVHDENSILNCYTSSQAGVFSSSWQQSPEFDAIYQNLLTAGTEADHIYWVKEAQKYLVENVVEITLFYTTDIGAWRKGEWIGIIHEPSTNLNSRPLLYAHPPVTTQYTLTISVFPTNWGTTNPASGTTTHNEGATVSVTGTAATNYDFDHWELDGTNVGTNPTYTVTMNRNHTLVGVFKQVVTTPTPAPPYELYATIGVVAVIAAIGWGLALTRKPK